jgi:antimicrobial peptide system SdpB family protein
LFVAAERFEPRGKQLAVARSLLATAQLAPLLFASDDTLFRSAAGLVDAPDCGGLRASSMWCMTGLGQAGISTGRLLGILVLLSVAAGVVPKWTCVPHWYVTFSFAAGVNVPNGGDQVAEVITLLLIPICLGDTRRWQWSWPSRPLPPNWRGAAYAAWLGTRYQLSIIYCWAALAKLASPSWRHGRAIALIFGDPTYGLPPWLRGLGGWIADHPSVDLLATWTVIGMELLIAAALLYLTPRRRRTVLVFAVVLHGGIIFAMGLGTFGATMIAAVAVACAGDFRLAGAATAPVDRPSAGSVNVVNGT